MDIYHAERVGPGVRSSARKKVTIVVGDAHHPRDEIIGVGRCIEHTLWS
jgi:hypothetical protein